MTRRPRLVMIDNVDSFTFMLADTLRVAGAEVRVVRSDSEGAGEWLDDDVDGVVISPGPGRPEDAVASLAAVRACRATRRPLLGVCLGHQVIAIACGGRVERVAPVHGKTGLVRHDGSGLFGGLPSPFAATRYHSLAVAELPVALVANAWGEESMTMGLRHRSAPIHGVQFHPESIASEQGGALIAAFVEVARNGA